MKNNIGIKAYLIDVANNHHDVITLDGSLNDYYKALNCDLFDIARRSIGGKYFDIMCDDEGLLKDNPKVSAISTDRSPMLCGNLLVVKHDYAGNTISLTQEEIEHIKKYICIISTTRYPIPYYALICVDY